MIIVDQSVELLACPSRKDALRLIEVAGRTCYKSEPKGDPGAFVGGIIGRGHLSVIEHCSATMKFVTDRGVSHEMVRHRLASYSQESTRYCNYSAGKHGGHVTFCRPVFREPGTPKYDRWVSAMDAAEQSYLNMCACGDSAQEARDALPNSTKTEIVSTWNFREWLLVFSLRRSKAAHPQMRALMDLAWPVMCEAVPEIFNDNNVHRLIEVGEVDKWLYQVIGVLVDLEFRSSNEEASYKSGKQDAYDRSISIIRDSLVGKPFGRNL